MRIIGFFAAALIAVIGAAPSKAATYIVYTGYSSGTATFFNGMTPDPPVTKAVMYVFTFVTPTISGPGPIAQVQGSNLLMEDYGMFNGFSAKACLAASPNGQLPTTDQSVIADCGSVFHYLGRSVNFTFEGNFYKLEAQSFSGTPSAYGVTSFDFTDAPAVPEPSTWLMMLIGIGAAGFAMRRAHIARPRQQS